MSSGMKKDRETEPDIASRPGDLCLYGCASPDLIGMIVCLGM